MIQANELIAQAIPGETEPLDIQLILKSGQREDSTVYSFRVPAKMWERFVQLVRP